MDNGTSTPRIYLKQPPIKHTPAGSSNDITLNTYGNSINGNRPTPSITYGGRPKVSVLSQVVPGAGSVNFKSAGTPTYKVAARPPGKPAPSVSSSLQYTQQARYHYGPSSTSASISASTTSGRHQFNTPTINYGGYNNSTKLLVKVPQSIEYNRSTKTQPETSVAIRQNPPTAPVIYRRGPKLAPSLRSTSGTDQNKFFVTSGLKVRKEFAPDQKDNSKTSHNKPVLALMPPSNSNTSTAYSSPSSPGSTSSSQNSDPPQPYVHARVPTQFANAEPTSSSVPKFEGQTQSSRNFYSSIVGSKGFTLSLSSSRQQQPPQLGSLKVPSNHSNHSSHSRDNENANIEESFTSDDLEVKSETDHNSDNLEVGTRDSDEPVEVIDNLQVKQARSDRKIMDLEISNASLMAVNKYLEKRLRSQAKDIQYLKVSNNDPTSSTTTKIPGFDSDSEDEESEDGRENSDKEENTNDKELDNSLERNRSPAELDLAEKTKLIEQRMQSHIKFLESSEKVNKIMRNCLLITDSLIEQGNKSLKFEVDPLDLTTSLQISNHSFITDSGDSSFNETVGEDSNEIADDMGSDLSIELSRPVLYDLDEEAEEEESDEAYEVEDDSDTVHGQESD